MKNWLGTGPQETFEDQDRAARRVAEARVVVARKEMELADAKTWLAKCEAWLAEFDDN